MAWLHLHITGGDGPDYFLGERLVVTTAAFDRAVVALTADGVAVDDARKQAAEESFWALGQEGVSSIPAHAPHCRNCGEVLPSGGQFCTDACAAWWEEQRQEQSQA